MADSDPAFLRYCVLYAIYLLERRGFLLSPKSVALPTYTIAWLGKELSSSPLFIRNSLDRVAHALLTLFQFFSSTYCRTRLRKILGLLQWLSRPAPDTAPFLASSYRQPRYFPLCMWSSLIQATLLCIRPAVPRPQPPPLTFAPIFVDAAAQNATRFRVGAVRPTHYMTSATAPAWIANQQTAEMYGLFHAVRQAALRPTSHLCLITDNAVRILFLRGAAPQLTIQHNCACYAAFGGFPTNIPYTSLLP